jgi:hypothetical protein
MYSRSTDSTSGLGASNCSGVISDVDDRSGVGAGEAGAEAEAAVAGTCCCCVGGGTAGTVGSGRGPRSGDGGSDLGSLLMKGKKLRSMESDEPARDDGADDDGEESTSIAANRTNQIKTSPATVPPVNSPTPQGRDGVGDGKWGTRAVEFTSCSGNVGGDQLLR